MIERVAELLRGNAAFIAEALRYLGVSVVALGADFAIYWLLLGVMSKALVPAAIGYASGLVVHYFLASRLVFAARLHERGIAAETPTFAKYAATGVAGLLLTAVIVGLCTDILGWSALLAKVIATGCAFVAVFFARRYLVFGTPASAAA